MLLIKNGKILTMEGTDLENGYVLLDGDKIASLGTTPPPGDYDVIDAEGGYVLPGFVDAHCHIGMWEESIGAEGDDGNEDTDPVTPHLRAIDAVNPADEAFRDAYKAGITTVVTGPGSANVFGGQFAALKTYGRRIDDMIVKEPLCQKIAVGENPKSVYQEKSQSPSTRMATAALIRETLKKAQIYGEDLQKYQKDPDNYDRPEYDVKLEALLPLLKGDIFAKVHAHRSDDIFTAIRIAKEFDIRITLEHCTEGHLIADYIKQENIHVVSGPSLCNRGKVELKNVTFQTAGVLSNAGVLTAIMTDHPETPIEYLPLCAALCVANGMDQDEALRAITINAAKICEIDGRVGSIRPGKDADIIIFKEPPLTLGTKPSFVMIGGERILG